MVPELTDILNVYKTVHRLKKACIEKAYYNVYQRPDRKWISNVIHTHKATIMFQFWYKKIDTVGLFSVHFKDK